MLPRLFRLSLGLVFALPLAFVTYALAQAASTPEVVAAPVSQDTPPDKPDCQECHAQYQEVWETSAHGQALSDPVFRTDWEAQGEPQECLGCHTTGFDPATGSYAAEGVTCAACHEPVASNHPLAPAFMSRSAELCGECHRDTEFEWQNSRHGESDLTCISCHDPHATMIKAEDTSSLCADCHGTRVAAFAHSNHAEEGLTCTDCHITATDTEPGMGNAQHSHTFDVDLNTCTQCHEYEIHNPAAAMLLAADGTGPTPEPPSGLNSGSAAAVTAEPQPTSPFGFAIFAGLIGLAFGIVLAPWLERGLRRIARGDAKSEA
jgi:predicted CXXCH cytochrome family protein